MKKAGIIIGIIVGAFILLIVVQRCQNKQDKFEYKFIKEAKYKTEIDNSSDNFPQFKSKSSRDQEQVETSLNTNIDPGMDFVVALKDRVYFYSKPDLSSKMTKTYFVKGQTANTLGTAGNFYKISFEYKGKVTAGYVLASEIGSAYEYEKEYEDEPGIFEDDVSDEEYDYTN